MHLPACATCGGSYGCWPVYSSGNSAENLFPQRIKIRSKFKLRHSTQSPANQTYRLDTRVQEGDIITAPTRTCGFNLHSLHGAQRTLDWFLVRSFTFYNGQKNRSDTNEGVTPRTTRHKHANSKSVRSCTLPCCQMSCKHSRGGAVIKHRGGSYISRGHKQAKQHTV